MAKQISMTKIVFSFILLLLSLAVSAQGKQSDDSTVFASDEVDVKPEFPGGTMAFYQLICKRLRIPDIEKNVVIKIYTSFIIEKDGSMSDVKVTNEIDEKLATETVKTLKAIKQKWVAAIKDGTAVRCAFILPITINIKGEDF